MLTAPPLPIGCTARHSAGKGRRDGGGLATPGWGAGTRPSAVPLAPPAARGPARFIPASLGAHSARQPPPPAAVKRRTGAALHRPPGEWRPGVSNAGTEVEGAPH
ncbi:unnamed protein product [Coccothraustes coccothraustes]